jgi:glycerate 2-kinase
VPSREVYDKPGKDSCQPCILVLHYFLVGTQSRVVLAPDKFKGSLVAAEVAEAVAAGLQAARGDVRIDVVPVADGGDGTLAVALARGYQPVDVAVSDALGRPAAAPIATRARHAIVELAAICGLPRLVGNRLRPEHCTTVGLGEAVRAALDSGCTRITVGLGGSASTDGGAGLLSGLGARLLDGDGRAVAPIPAELGRVTTVDLSGLDPRLPGTEIDVAVDVDAPLLGHRGAAAVFGPQKGASQDTVQRLEQTMRHWAELLNRARPRADPAHPGSGAPGGAAFAALAIGARLVDGAETFLDLAGFDETTAGASLVITGEGRLDRQTLMGKAPAVVARRATRLGVPCVAVVGSRSPGLTDAQLHQHGFSDAHQLIDVAPAAARDADLSRSALTALGAHIARRHLPAFPPVPTY